MIKKKKKLSNDALTDLLQDVEDAIEHFFDYEYRDSLKKSKENAKKVVILLNRYIKEA